MDYAPFMRRAAALALEKMQGGTGGPFGALIVRGREVIAEGWNAVTATNDPTAHAEVMAIREACRRLGTFSLPDCEIVTSCEPCPMCLGAIYWARLKHIHYANTRHEAAAVGFDDAAIYDEMPKLPEARSVPATRLVVPESAAPFAAWAAKGDKVKY
jgi:tRNA(Arg) A34 adenosine deaminase TadA